MDRRVAIVASLVFVFFVVGFVDFVIVFFFFEETRGIFVLAGSRDRFVLVVIASGIARQS